MVKAGKVAGVVLIAAAVGGGGVAVGAQLPRKIAEGFCTSMLLIQAEIIRANLPEWAQYQAAFLNTYKRWPTSAEERDAYEADMKAKGIDGVEAIRQSQARWVTW